MSFFKIRLGRNITADTAFLIEDPLSRGRREINYSDPRCVTYQGSPVPRSVRSRSSDEENMATGVDGTKKETNAMLPPKQVFTPVG